MSPAEPPIDWHRVVPDDRLPLAADSRQRIAWLCLAFVGLAGLVLARCLWIHIDSGPAYRAAALRPSEIRQAIPARRGTILDRRGVVLAEDRPVDVLTLHYRWLQQPPDPGWLKRQAQQSLSPLRRRDPAAVAEATKRVAGEIRQLHRRLARECGLSDQQWESRRRHVQQGVERTAAAVNRRRRTRYQQDVAPTAGPHRDEGRWSTLLTDAIKALFTPPEPLPPPAVIIREETQHHVMYRGVDVAWKERIERSPEKYPGVRVQQRRIRTYPHGSLAAHLIGYVSPQDPPEASGRAGIELAGQRQLAGRPGSALQQATPGGETAEPILETAAIDGRDLVTTLDWRLQAVAERLLDDACRRRDIRQRRRHALGQPPLPAGGSMIVVDVFRGEILAMASGPRFDPNDFAQGDTPNVRRWLAEPNRAMFDRSIQMAIPPGSVFKPAMAIAMLEAADLDPAAPLICRGYLQTPDRQRCMVFRRYGIGHGPTHLADALAQSCNVYFFHYAGKMAPEALTHWAMRFGFGQRTGIDLPAESAANLPTPGDVLAGHRAGWQEADSQALAIGQGRLTATPLQIVRMMAALANGGSLIVPRVTRAEVALRALPDLPATLQGMRIPGLRAASLEAVREGLLRVVDHPAGTAHRTVFIDGLPVAGKTGTAEAGPGQEDHAWFAGYAPADDPRIALVVVLEHAGDGSVSAGPAARQLLLTIRRLGYVGKPVTHLSRTEAGKK